MKKVLYIHGLREFGGNNICNYLRKYLPDFEIDSPKINHRPEQGMKDFEEIDIKHYDLVIGFSLGGLYAQLIQDKPVVVINPAFGISLKIEQYKGLEDSAIKSNNKRIIGIFGEHDRHLVYHRQGYIDKIGDSSIEYYPGEHVPTEEEIKNYISKYILNFTQE